jgi:hypothetical protein
MRQRVDLESANLVFSFDPTVLLDIDDLISRLAEEEPQAAAIVKLRLFAGLSIEQAGQALGIARSTAFDLWSYARAWLTCELNSQSR